MTERDMKTMQTLVEQNRSICSEAVSMMDEFLETIKQEEALNVNKRAIITPFSKV